MITSRLLSFESSVNSYDSQTFLLRNARSSGFESSVNSYDSQTYCANDILYL